MRSKIGAAKRLRSLARAILAFNQHSRDLWVADQARAVPADATVLDVGAGTCLYKHLFAHCRYKSQDACQLDPTINNGYGVIDFVSDICRIPVEHSSFDVIVCTEVLEHVPEPIRALEEFSRILKPGGRLLLTAPLGSGLHQLPFHFYGGYTPQWYRRFLTAYGFIDVNVVANGGFFEHFGQESQRFASLLSPWGQPRNLPYLPIWLVVRPVFGYLMPLICAILSRVDTRREFTVGYHVTATKAP